MKQPIGTTTDGTDEVLAKLRVSLDKLAEVQREDAPNDASMDVRDAAPRAAKVLDQDVAEVEMAREKEKGLAGLEREDEGLAKLEREEQEAYRQWLKRIIDPATPTWQWLGATTPPFERPKVSTLYTNDRLPGQSEEQYLRTVDPRVPAREWKLDNKIDFDDDNDGE